MVSDIPKVALDWRSSEVQVAHQTGFFRLHLARRRPLDRAAVRDL